LVLKTLLLEVYNVIQKRSGKRVVACEKVSRVVSQRESKRCRYSLQAGVLEAGRHLS